MCFGKACGVSQYTVLMVIVVVEEPSRRRCGNRRGCVDRPRDPRLRFTQGPLLYFRRPRPGG